jgi:hypothetical protein
VVVTGCTCCSGFGASGVCVVPAGNVLCENAQNEAPRQQIAINARAIWPQAARGTRILPTRSAANSLSLNAESRVAEE